MNKPLTVEIKGDELRISIGINTLAYAVQMGGQWGSDFYVNEPAAFAKSIETELQREEEDGTTPVHRLFDTVAVDAYDGVEEGNVQLGIDLVTEKSGIKGRLDDSETE